MKKLSILFGVLSLVMVFIVGNGYSACEGDINCSGTVDGADLALLATDFGTTGCGTSDDVVARIDELENRIAQLEALLENVTRISDDIYIEGANLHIRNGSGSTSGIVNGHGNLIIGYNENTVAASRTGSHNLVLGIDHEYTSYAGLLAGRENRISGSSSVVMGHNNEVTANYSTISGGQGNTVSSIYSSASGGYSNTVSAAWANISGGRDNAASGNYSSISGGRYNITSGLSSSVCGGGGEESYNGNQAFGDYSVVLGGDGNIAGDSNLIDNSIGIATSVCGGRSNNSRGNYSSISGGAYNIASGIHSSVSGGSQNTASGNNSSVTGGGQNNASESHSGVAGGIENEASGEYSFISGGYLNIADGNYSAISGGDSNQASGSYSVVSGGYGRFVNEVHDWRAGGCFFL